MIKTALIVGGGIAGTVAAIGLRKAGIDVTVIEARPENHGQGAVVRLNPNGMDALKALGVAQDIISVSFPLLRAEIYAPNGQRVGHRLGADPSSDRGLPRVLSWPVLSHTLETVAAQHGAQFRHNARVTSVSDTADGAAATLDTGETLEADVLIGADGARSLVRRAIDNNAPEPEFIGTRTVYGFTPKPATEPPPPEVLRAWVGGAVPFFAATRDSFTGGSYFFTSLPASQEAAERDGGNVAQLRDELTQLVDGDTVSPAAELIAEADRLLAFDDYALEHLPHWYSNHMIVIGDAAHVAPPASEQGAAIGVEDGVILAQCLRDYPTPQEAFGAYEKQRRERVEKVVAMGTQGTRSAHENDHTQKPQEPETVTNPVGGPAWAFDHHIDW